MPELSHQSLLDALGKRYDSASARVVLAELLETTRLEARDRYTEDEVERLCRALERVDRRATRAVAALRHGLSWQTREAPTPAAVEAAPFPGGGPDDLPEPEPAPDLPFPNPDPLPDEGVPGPEPEPDLPFPEPEPEPDTPVPTPPAVRFVVHDVHTEPGQAVFLCGDHAALGAWDPQGAVLLDPTDYPSWSKRLELAPGTALSFKFGVRDDAGGVRWQPGDNHVVVVPPDGEAVHEVRWEG